MFRERWRVPGATQSLTCLLFLKTEWASHVPFHQTWSSDWEGWHLDISVSYRYFFFLFWPHHGFRTKYKYVQCFFTFSWATFSGRLYDLPYYRRFKSCLRSLLGIHGNTLLCVFFISSIGLVWVKRLAIIFCIIRQTWLNFHCNPGHRRISRSPSSVI